MEMIIYIYILIQILYYYKSVSLNWVPNTCLLCSFPAMSPPPYSGGPGIYIIIYNIIIMHVKTDFDLQFSAGIHNSYNVFPSYWLNKEKSTYDSPTPVVKEDHSNFKVYTFTL